MQAPGAVDEDREGGFKHGGWQDGLFDDVLGDAIGEIFERDRCAPAGTEDL